LKKNYGIDGKQDYLYKPTSSGWKWGHVGSPNGTWTALASGESLTWLESKYGKAADLAAGKTSTTTTSDTTSNVSGELSTSQLSELKKTIDGYLDGWGSSSNIAESMTSYKWNLSDGVVTSWPGASWELTRDGKLTIEIPKSDWLTKRTYTGKLSADLKNVVIDKTNDGLGGTYSLRLACGDLIRFVTKSSIVSTPKLSDDRFSTLASKIYEGTEAISGTYESYITDVLSEILTPAGLGKLYKKYKSMYGQNSSIVLAIYNDGEIRMLYDWMYARGFMTRTDYQDNDDGGDKAFDLCVKICRSYADNYAK
jgi:hypothetical protein